MRMAGTEFNVVAHHQNADALRGQAAQDQRKLLLEFSVQSLCRFVQQQNVRLQQQYLTQRGSLLLPAGEIVGMPVKEVLQPAQRYRTAQMLLLNLRCILSSLIDFKEILPHGLFYKQGLWILRQKRQTSLPGDFSAVGRQQSCQQLQAGGLSRSVAAEQGKKFSLP